MYKVELSDRFKFVFPKPCFMNSANKRVGSSASPTGRRSSFSSRSRCGMPTKRKACKHVFMQVDISHAASGSLRVSIEDFRRQHSFTICSKNVRFRSFGPTGPKKGNYMRKCASGGQSLANAERGVGMSGYEWICWQDRGLTRLRPHWDQGRVLHFGLETGCDYTTIVRW